MAEVLSVNVQAQTVITDPGSITQALFTRLQYSREVPTDDDVDGAPQTFNIEGSRREELDTSGKANINVEDFVSGSFFKVQIETAQGSVLWKSDEFTRDAKGAPTKVAVPDAVFDAAQKKNPAASPTLTRSGRFVRLDDNMPDFSGYRLFVAAIRPAKIGDISNPQTAAVRKILGLSGNGEVTSFEVGKIDPKKLDPEAVNAIALQTATIRVDGAFDLSIDIVGDEIEWLWLLLGPQNYAGCQLDAVPVDPRPAAIIMLPFDAVSTDRDTAAATSATNENGNIDSGAANGKHGDVPMEFDEQQLVDHPGQFSDDPGKFCTPFENPQRVLEEKPFFTVLRIDQPEIGGQGSLKMSRPILLDLAPPIKMSVVADAFKSARGDDLGAFSKAASSPLTTLNMIRLGTTAAVQPRIDFRNLINAAVFEPSRRPWAKWVRDRSKGRKQVSGDNPIEWDGDPTIYQAASVVGGHILEWRVQTRSNGYSLGSVNKSITLAPRQTRRISKISWRRREQAARREDTEATDALTQVTTRGRDYTDAVRSSLSEWSKGGSKSRSTGVAGGLGFSIGDVVIGGGAAHGRASSSSWQNGGRRVAAAEQQQLRDAIRQYGESVRNLESTVVEELSQEEEVEGVSETLRNVNHCHSLTVLYYEILRHVRVDTSFAGVRECLYVPFSVTPFDLDKALKWRDKLRHGMLNRSLRWGLDRLDEVASAWADSDIPPGRRSQFAINHITGSVYLQLSIDRVREKTEEEALEDYEKLWRPFAALFGFPVRKIIETIRRNERQQDEYFQREVAPKMASRWTNLLQLVVGDTPIESADFTLASSYRFGQVVRVDFTASIDGSLNREQLRDITIKSSQSLPPGSVANVTRMALHYYTDHFDKGVGSDRGTRDLIQASTGLPEEGATAHFEVSDWERQNLRETIERAVEKLIIHLNANLVYYHKVVWWLMDRDELYMMLDGFTAPYGRRFEDGQWLDDPGRSLASVLERDPIAILGNTLVFRVAAGAFLGIDGHDSPDAAHRYYYDSQARTEPMRISLPTEGLYAQALMDKCMACEEHNGSTDWVLTDQDPELESIADQLSSRRSAPENLNPTNFPDTIISLQNAPAAPDPSGLSGVLGSVTNAGAFRDMAGLAGTQANAAAALQAASNLATSFGQKAVDLQKAKIGTDNAKKKLDNIKKAESSGLIDRSDAKKQAAKVLDEQNMTPDAPNLTAEAPIRDAIGSAVAAGSAFEASRTTKDGTQAVRIGNNDFGFDPSQRSWIITDPSNGMSVDRRTFGQNSHDMSGETTLSVAVPNLPPGGVVRWNIPDGDSRTRIAIINDDGTVGTSATGTTVSLRGYNGGVAAIQCAVYDNSGTRLESASYAMSVPRFVWIGQDASTEPHLTTNLNMSATDVRNMFSTARDALRIRFVQVNVRFVWENAGMKLPAHLGTVNDVNFPGSERPIENVVIGRVIADPNATDPRSGLPYTPFHLGQAYFPAGVLPGDPSLLNAGNDLDLFEVAQTHLHTYLTPAPELFGTAILDAVSDGLRDGTLGAIERGEALVFFGRLVGSVMAHEFGHVLLRTPHLAVGIGHLMVSANKQSVEELAGVQLLPGGGAGGGHGFATLPANQMSAFSATTITTFNDRDHFPAAPPLLERDL